MLERIFFGLDFHNVYLMYWLIDSTGSNMPMKIVPINAAMKNSNIGSANETAVWRLRFRSL